VRLTVGFLVPFVHTNPDL